MIVASTVPLRADEVIHFPSGEFLCLHHLETGEYYLLDEVAALIWELCDGVLDVDGIAGEVTRSFDVDDGTALTDALELLRDLEAEDCLCP
ncbi:MAG: PqqD family protein [Acidimicrobiia bacterium]